MGFTLTVLFEAAVLILNAITVLNEPRFLVKSARSPPTALRAYAP